MRQSEVRDTEQLLAATGSKVRLADTAEQRQQLEAMPPYRLLSRTKDDSVECSYADPKYCRCDYVGGPEEYSEYARLVTERQIARDRRWTEEYT